MEYLHRVIAVLTGMWLLAGAVVAGDCVQAQQYNDVATQALESKDYQAAVGPLNQSLDLCPGFANWYQLGVAQSQLGDAELAQAAFERAIYYSESMDQRSEALARYGQLLGDSGELPEAVTVLHSALRSHSSPAPEWLIDAAKQHDLALADHPITVEQIQRSLDSSHYPLLRLPLKGEADPAEEPEPSINVRINFLFDSSKVDESSLEKVTELATSLSDEAFTGRHFLLIGHSDASGGADYNAQLSLERAESVRDMMIDIEPRLKGRVDATGYGESSPLYPGDSEEDYQLNRRLEVVVE